MSMGAAAAFLLRVWSHGIEIGVPRGQDLVEFLVAPLIATCFFYRQGIIGCCTMPTTSVLFIDLTSCRRENIQIKVGLPTSGTSSSLNRFMFFTDRE